MDTLHTAPEPPRSHGAGEATLLEHAAQQAVRQAHRTGTLSERLELAELAQALFDEATRCRG